MSKTSSKKRLKQLRSWQTHQIKKKRNERIRSRQKFTPKGK